MEQSLINAGLTELQSQAYLFLLEHGPSAPKTLVSGLNISRTNTYKVLESLQDFDLVVREERNKKIIYSPSDPIALASLVANRRNEVISLEHNVNLAMQQLRDSYNKHNHSISIEAQSGKNAMTNSYTNQASHNKPIYFFKTRADIPFFGFETMDKIRKEQGKAVPKRYAITPDVPEANLSKNIDDGGNLFRTWINEKSYTAPVEWSVSGDQVVIQVFEGEGETVVIGSQIIAESFRQIWSLTDIALRNDGNYSRRPTKAKRLI